MNGRSLSVYPDTSFWHEYLCTPIQNGHEFCKLLIKLPQTVMFFYYNYPHEFLMSLIIFENSTELCSYKTKLKIRTITTHMCVRVTVTVAIAVAVAVAVA